MTTKQTPWFDRLINGKYQALDDELLAGSLEARRSAKGIVFYWRLDVRPKTYRYKIGPWDSTSPPLKAECTDKGYSRAAAKACAQGMIGIHSSSQWKDVGGYPAYLESLEVQRQANQEKARTERQAKESQAQAMQVRQSFTLERLITEYCDHLQALGKQSAYDARNLLTKHVIKGNTKLALMAACDIDAEQIADAIRVVNEQGKGRTANKMRSYLRAAYAMATKARTSPAIPLSFKAFKIRHNPVMDVALIADGNRTDKAPLLGDGLMAYWRAIEGLAGIEGHILRLHLLTGGQRVAQLCRVSKADLQDNQLVLLDPKGKRQQARVHNVPLTATAMAEVLALKAMQTRGNYLISTDGGLTPAWPSTINDYAKRAAGLKGFTIKRLRSGVETLLSSKGISREIRAQLQSHGLSGVQNASYDGHDYRAEKLHALETLYSALNQVVQPNVVNLR